MTYRPTRVEIDLSALLQNLTQVKAFAPKSKILAIIKANGYGHGIIRVASQLSSADGFGVASIDEAILLRQNGFLHKIILLEGLFGEQELELVIQHRLEVVVHSFYQLEWLESVSSSKISQITVWIKIDTGMHRLGFLGEELVELKARIAKLKNLANINWLSHFSSADSSVDFTQQQIKKFAELTARVTGEKSLANSAAIERFAESHLDWVRPGIMLYGVGGHKQSVPNFKPVMTFCSQIISLKWLERGDSVGYDNTWSADKKTLIAIVAVGYGDGYPRHAETGTPVFISGQILPLVGRVSMDMINVDVTLIADKVFIGSEVILWGKNLPVAKVAKFASTISYELLCGITERVPKIEVKDD
jgi:alanine racemase